MKVISSGKVLHSSSFHKKKRRKTILLSVLALFLAVGFGYSIIFFLRHEKFVITEIIVSGEDIIDRDKIVRSASDLIQGFYLWVIPRGNRFLYPHQAVKETLLVDFPRLKSVDFDVDAQTLFISIEEREAEFLYCPEALKAPEVSGCYFADEEGLVFAPAPEFLGQSYFVYGTRHWPTEPLGKKFVETEELSALSSFIENLRNLDIRPVSLEFGEDGYTLLADTSLLLMWRREFSLESIYANLSAFLAEESIKQEKDFLERVSYLDMRVEDKVFYRFRR